MFANLSLIFGAIVVLNLILKLYLNYRQAKSIKQQFTHVPEYFKNKITLEQHQKAQLYTLAKLRLNSIHNIFIDAVLLVMTLGGVINLLCDCMYSLNIPLIWQNILLIFSFNIILAICELPVSYYSTFRLEEKFGFNKQTRKLFISDQIKSAILALIIFTPLLYLVLTLMNYFNVWWALTWGVLVVFNLLMLMIYPKFIAPLFNKFTPLKDESLNHKIQKLLQECKFKASGIFIMDGSSRSSHGNAYFTGFGSSKRIVFFDTLLKNLNHEEILAVLAHELGHYKKNHVIKQVIFSFVLLFVILFALDRLSNHIWYYSLFNLNDFNDANAMISFIILFSFLTLPFKPLFSYFMRKNEFEADDFAKHHTNKHALISGLVKLYKDNASTLTPDDWYVKFYYSHPPASTRINHLLK